MRRYPVGGVLSDDFDVVEVAVLHPWLVGAGAQHVHLGSIRPPACAWPHARRPTSSAFPPGQAMDGIMAVGEVIGVAAPRWFPPR